MTGGPPGGRRARALLTVAAVLTACTAGPLQAPTARTASSAALPRPAPATAAPSGTVRVAYPAEPSTFLAPTGTEVAADDLAALWGLPLLRLDVDGQVRRGLVEDWEVVGAATAGWTVRLHLRDGAWSDGRPVEADDVVATLRARASTDPARFGVIVQAEAVDADTVSVAFDRPYTAWADLLVEAGTVLPRDVVTTGTAAYARDVPVSGGRFRLLEHVPGLRAVFEAHPSSPLGPPGLERLEVLFTPSFETALGLLEDGRVDALVGYLALNGVARATDVEGATAASPLGGTTVSLAFRPDGALGGADRATARRGVAGAVDVSELVEGMLGATGERATTPWPGVPAPGPPPDVAVPVDQPLVLLYPAGSEVLGFTARAVQRDLVARGMTVDLVGEPAPRFAQVLGQERDVALVVRRTPRRPALGPWVDDSEAAHAAGAAPSPAGAAPGLTAVTDAAWTAPLFHVGVLHAWTGVEGIRPSSWPGAGFWNAGEWTAAGGR